jgi:hypothetical protein
MEKEEQLARANKILWVDAENSAQAMTKFRGFTNLEINKSIYTASIIGCPEPVSSEEISRPNS